MKATFLLENLSGKLSSLNNSISQRAQLPVLSGFLLQAEKGKIKLSGTDLEIGVATSAPASVEEEGQTVVPAKPFSELIQSMVEEKITIETKESSVVVSGKKTRASFVSMDPADFPSLFEEKGEELLIIKKENIAKDLARVVFATSQDAGRPAFSGVLIRQDKEGVLLVATDSHRLSKNLSAGIKEKPGREKTQFIVTARIIRALLSNKSDEDVVVSVSKKNNQILFSQGDTVLVGRLIDAEYPEFEKIIPAEFSTRAEFDKTEMQNALKTTSIFARDNANIIRLSVRKDSVGVWAKSQSLGENSVEVSAKTTGEQNEIAFNGRYLLELLQNIDEDQIVFEMTGPLNPGVFKVAGNKNFVHLIMPIRIKEEDLS